MRVLIADDEFLVAMAVRCELEALGHAVVGMARDGREAVALCDSLHPDLVLMDVQMPEMDGLAATRHLMAHRPVCVVIVTGKAHSAQAAEEAGAMGYAEKPLVAWMIAPLLASARARFTQFLAQREKMALTGEALPA